MRRAAITGLMVLVAASSACSGDAGTPTTSTTSTTATTTSAPATTTTTPPTTTTAPPATSTTTTSTTTTSTTTTTLPPWPLAEVATLDGEISFTVDIADEDDPALPLGEVWDTSFSYSPYVTFDDEGTFHMFFTGWGPRTAGIGHATSVDGRFFERSSDEPVLTNERTENGRTITAQAPLAYQAADGSWVMYFSDLVSRRFDGKSVWRATAPEAMGPWTVDEDPIYTSTADWERETVTQELLVTDAGLLILYDGIDGEVEIGALWSADGVTFIPFDDPSTPDVSDPVLSPVSGQAWDGLAVGSPIPFARDDGDIDLFYIGFEGPDNRSGDRILRVGYARGDLESPWRRYADNPVVESPTQNSAPASLGYPWMSGVEVGEAFHLYYALGAGSRGVGVMTVTIEE